LAHSEVLAIPVWKKTLQSSTGYCYMCPTSISLCFECSAVLARRKLSGEPQTIKAARDLGKASYVTSIAGIVVAAFIIVIILIIVVSRQFAEISTVECP